MGFVGVGDHKKRGRSCSSNFSFVSVCIEPMAFCKVLLINNYKILFMGAIWPWIIDLTKLILPKVEGVLQMHLKFNFQLIQRKVITSDVVAVDLYAFLEKRV